MSAYTKEVSLYPADMAKRDLVNVRDFRKEFAEKAKSVLAGTHLVITRYGNPQMAVVPMDWYREAAEKMGEPTEF